MGAYIVDGVATEPSWDRPRMVDWRLKQAHWFHRCFDTKKIIWPFTKAYRATRLQVSSRVRVDDPQYTKWITTAAYTFRVLKEKSQ